MNKINWLLGHVSIEAEMSLEAASELRGIDGLAVVNVETSVDGMGNIQSQLQERITEILTGSENNEKIKSVDEAARAMGIELDLSADTIGEAVSLFERPQ